MKTTRRDFLRLLGTGAALTAAGVLVPGAAAQAAQLIVEPRRQLWQVPGTAPVPWRSRELGEPVPRPRMARAALRRPYVLDDRSHGYNVGDFWFNGETGEAFICMNATEGAAQWWPISRTKGG